MVLAPMSNDAAALHQYHIPTILQCVRVYDEKPREEVAVLRTIHRAHARDIRYAYLATRGTAAQTHLDLRTWPVVWPSRIGCL